MRAVEAAEWGRARAFGEDMILRAGSGARGVPRFRRRTRGGLLFPPLPNRRRIKGGATTQARHMQGRICYGVINISGGGPREHIYNTLAQITYSYSRARARHGGLGRRQARLQDACSSLLSFLLSLNLRNKSVNYVVNSHSTAHMLGSARPGSALIDALRVLLDAERHTELMRLGTAALYELAWRARGVGGAADNGTVDVVLPDPEVACTTSDGQRHMLCDLELPAHGTAAAMRLSTSLHAFCCEAAAANGHWDAVGRHARMGLACQRSVERGRPARHVQTPWQQLWFVHASLLARTMGGGAAGVVVGTFVADPQATLLRQLREHSERRLTAFAAGAHGGCDSVAGASLRLCAWPRFVGSVTWTAACSTATSRVRQRLKHEALLTIGVALRCALRETSGESSGGAAAWV